MILGNARSTAELHKLLLEQRVSIYAQVRKNDCDRGDTTQYTTRLSEKQVAWMPAAAQIVSSHPDTSNPNDNHIISWQVFPHRCSPI